MKLNEIIFSLLIVNSFSATAAKQNLSNLSLNTKKVDDISKQEVVDNPTLKTLSGSLNRWSLYSNYTYRGGSLESPASAERPNIRDVDLRPNLASMSGVFGIKYRLTKQDSLTLKTGLFSIAPFHSELDSDNAQNQRDFDNNNGRLDTDDIILSYFRTYYLGNIQNVSFVSYQYITRESYRDYGGRGILRFSQSSAYKVNKAFYIAGRLNYENYAYDSDTFKDTGISIRSRQQEHRYRGDIAAELYVRRDLSFRLMSDIFSYVRFRDDINAEDIKLQQTLAMTYFYSRDISIAPSINFIAEDLRDDRTNLGLNVNINL